MIRRFGSITAGTLLVLAGLMVAARAAGATDLDRAPEVTFRSLEGAPVPLSDFRGKLVLLNFWGTWCAPCLVEIPELVRLSHQFKTRGLEVVGVAVDSGHPDDIREFMGEHGMDYQIVIGNLDAVKRRFHVLGFPTSFLIDHQGAVLKRYVGPQSGEVLRNDVQPHLP